MFQNRILSLKKNLKPTNEQVFFPRFGYHVPAVLESDDSAGFI